MLSNFDIFSDDQAITADAASTNYVDVGDFAGRGEPVDVLIRVTEDFDLLTSLHVSVQQCDTTGGTYADVASTAEVVLADLVVGYEFKIRFLPLVTQRYIKLHYDVTGTAPTAGKIFAAVEAGEDFPYEDGLYFDGRNTSGAASTA